MGKEDVSKITKDEALSRAARLCSGSEYCTSQVLEKLIRWGVSAEEAADVVGKLVAERFIDNRRFACAYCHDKFFYSHWGRIKIAQMLRHLRLSDEEIAEGLATIPDESYPKALHDALIAKDRSLHDTDLYQRKAKLVRHLLSRGYEMSLAIEAVDQHLKL